MVNYDKQLNCSTTWKVLGPELTACEYEMEESSSISLRFQECDCKKLKFALL